MARPFTMHNSMRVYDRMVADWVNSCPVDYGNLAGQDQSERGMLWVYATPEKVFGEVWRLLARKGWTVPGTTGIDGQDPEDWQFMPQPFAAIRRQHPTPDPSRGWPPFKFRRFLRARNGWQAVRPPLPVNITYTVEYYMDRKFTEAHLLEWLYSKLTPIGAAQNEFFMHAEYDRDYVLWGTKLIPAQQWNIMDNTDLEGGEWGDRFMRMTFEFTLRAWIFHVPEPAVPMVLRVVTEFGVENYTGRAEQIDRVLVDQDVNITDPQIDNDPTFWELGTGSTQTGDDTFSIPAGDYIQTVDIPTLGDELVFVNLDLELDAALPDGLTIQIQNYNGTVLSEYVVGEGEASINATIWTFVDQGTNGVRVRLLPSDAASLAVNDVDVRPVTYGMSEEWENLLPGGDMETGSAADWQPYSGETTTPSVLEMVTTPVQEGSRSLHLETTADGQGIERTLNVTRPGNYILRLALQGDGGVLELAVGSGSWGSETSEKTFLIRPAMSRWDTFHLPIFASGAVSLRARQHGSTATTLYIDQATIVRVPETGWVSSQSP